MVALLVFIGILGAVGRALFPANIISLLDPSRSRLVHFLGLSEMDREVRRSEVAKMDGSFAQHRFATYLHVIPGGIFLALAPLQFSRRLRGQYPRFHRWSGRLLLLDAVVVTASALFFGVIVPYAGPPESVAIIVIATFFIFALGRGFVAIRQGAVERHREWMIRGFAAALAISSIRLVGAFLDLFFTPLGLPLPEGFVLSLWIGWASTVSFAELWIRRTRPSRTATVARPLTV